MGMVVTEGWGRSGGECGGGGEGGEGRLSFLAPWMGLKTTKGIHHVASTSMTTAKDGNGDLLHAVQQCGIHIQSNEAACLRSFNTVASSSSSSLSWIGEGEREAWREVRDGLEALWRGLIESECKCHNPEMLDRMYEGLRERTGEIVAAGDGGGGGGGEGVVLEG